MRLYIFRMFIVGIVVFSVLTALSSSAAPKGDKSGGGCPVNMVPVGPICVDMYEASVWSLRPQSNGTPQGQQFGTAFDNYPCHDNGNNCSDTATNPIYAASVPRVTPSAFITWFQAQQACANVGKRLLTNAEWQMAAAGTPEDSASCNTLDGAVAKTGSRSNCISNWGVLDMVGNYFEWVADWIQGDNDGSWQPFPGTSNSAFGDDLIFGINPAFGQGTGQNFPAALIRGGAFDQGGNAGVFTLGAQVAPSYSDLGTGFRCAR